MITGFTKPDSGKIKLEIDGQVYDAIPSHQLGYLPEDRGLYPEKTLLKNILYFAQLNGMQKESALTEADKWLESFDLLERKNDQLKSLSKGNQQKSSVHNPSWVILDEPFSGLDPVNQEKVVDFLSELTAKGMTVILSAHQMAMVEKLAKRILLMNKGEAVFYGNLTDFQKQEEGQTKVRVTFAAAINKNTATSILETLDHQWINECKLEIALNADRSLNDLLAELPTLGEVVKVQSEQLDLHQLYLQAITKHGVPADE
jgi:ABC-2 type transport system ATP-binding protein